jgi:hypothetical protein
MTAACATDQGGGLMHGYFMKGQVVRAREDQTIVCIGHADGAALGQVFDVYRYIDVDPAEEADHEYFDPEPTYGSFPTKERVGAVEIARVVNAHFAEVRVIEGDIAKNDFVELKRK